MRIRRTSAPVRIARAGRPRPRHVGDPRVLLGRRRAAEHAHARADAALGVAAQIAVRPAEPLGAAARDRGVLARELRRHLGDRQRLLHPLEARRAATASSSSRPNSRRQRSSTRARRAKAGARVDQRRAADAAAERQRDRRVAERDRLPAVAVEPREHLRRAGGEVVGSCSGPCSSTHDARAALRQLGGERPRRRRRRRSRTRRPRASRLTGASSAALAPPQTPARERPPSRPIPAPGRRAGSS